MLISKKYQYVKLFSGSVKPRMLLFLLINVKIAKIVCWHFNIFEQENKLCSAVLSMKICFITSGPDFAQAQADLSYCCSHNS